MKQTNGAIGRKTRAAAETAQRMGSSAVCFLLSMRWHPLFPLAVTLALFEDMFAIPEFLVAHDRAECVSSIATLLLLIGNDAFAVRLRKACAHFIETVACLEPSSRAV